MATGFRKVLGRIQAHSAALAALDGNDPVADHDVIAGIWEDVDNALRPAVNRFVERAKIQDEDSRVYGPKMVAKVRT